MPRYLINNIPILWFDEPDHEEYWRSLSNHLINAYGNNSVTDHYAVEEILLEGYNFLINEFSSLVLSETSLSFFLYVFWLHELSIKIHRNILGGLKINEIEESQFSTYRRILKLILEQGCDIDLVSGGFPTRDRKALFESKIEKLLYLGNWIYMFTDYIAFQKMIDECYNLRFDENNLLKIDWNHNYGEIYSYLFPKLGEDYEQGTFDRDAVPDLLEKINDCFGIDYNTASGLIFEIKRHHSPHNSIFQTIQPHILPENLRNIQGITFDKAKSFYDGLILSRENKFTIDEVVRKPYSTNRHLFRPILIYNIGGEERALVGNEKLAESIVVLGTNSIHWNNILEEWKQNECMQKFINKKGKEHDKILEDQIEKVIKNKNLYYCRNIKSFKQPNSDNIKIDNHLVGEIDFIIVNIELEKVFVVEAKYNRAKYEGIGFRNDYTNFVNNYEFKLQRKVSWISTNLIVLQEHIKLIEYITDLNLDNYSVEGIFIINTPTFYMFNGDFKAITLNQIFDFLDDNYEFNEINIPIDQNNHEYITVEHPFFRNPNT